METFAFGLPPAFRVVPLASQPSFHAPRKRSRVDTLAGRSSLRHSSFVPESTVPCPSSRKIPLSPIGPVTMSLGKVVVAGGTGFIGSRLVRKLVADGVAVTVLTRSASSAANLPSEVTVQTWSPGPTAGGGAGLEKALSGADLVVNLCGTPVVSRWDTAGKQLIINSRVHPTSTLVRTITALPESARPRCVVSASAIGYYGTSDSTTFDEGAAVGGDDFLADVCKQWENAAAPLADLPGTRLVITRIGVVMGVGGGALARMLPAFQLGLGGPVGSGSQWLSWIHIDDLVAMFIAAGESDTVSGVYNATSPNAVTMRELSAALARALKRPNLFPVPGFVLRFAFGQGADVVLKGQRVLPTHWLSEGFKFIHPNIDNAMGAVAMEVSR